MPGNPDEMGENARPDSSAAAPRGYCGNVLARRKGALSVTDCKSAIIRQLAAKLQPKGIWGCN
jgi:hypothetical protein